MFLMDGDIQDDQQNNQNDLPDQSGQSGQPPVLPEEPPLPEEEENLAPEEPVAEEVLPEEELPKEESSAPPASEPTTIFENTSDNEPLVPPELSVETEEQKEELSPSQEETEETLISETPEAGQFPEEQPKEEPVTEEESFATPVPSSLPETPEPSTKLPKKFPLPIFFIAGAIILIILAFSVFKSLLGKGKPSGKTVLTYWGLWEPEPVIQGIIAEYQKEHSGVEIKYIQQDKEDYYARLQSAFTRGSGPDIFRFHTTWVSPLEENLSAVPAETVKSLGMESAYFPVIAESLKENNQFYGIPLMAEALALFYNKDILTAANKSAPRTWWGLEKLAKELTVTVEERITVAGAALGTVNNVDHWSDIIGLMIFQNNSNPSLADSLVEDVIRYYLRFSATDRVWDETLPNSTTAFAGGKLAFYFAPSWRIFNLLEANPNLNFAVTTVPQLPKVEGADWEAVEEGEGELTEVGWASFWAEGVWLKSKNQKAAWDFLQFLGSKETLQKLYTAQGQTRLFGEIYPRADLAASLENDPLLSPFVKEMKMAKTWPLCSFTHDGALNDRMIKYYEDAINGFSDGGDGAKILETLGSGVKQVEAQYKMGT